MPRQATETRFGLFLLKFSCITKIFPVPPQRPQTLFLFYLRQEWKYQNERNHIDLCPCRIYLFVEEHAVEVLREPLEIRKVQPIKIFIKSTSKRLPASYGNENQCKNRPVASSFRLLDNQSVNESILHLITVQNWKY